MDMNLYDRCQVRYVAGRYFLLDMEQSFDSYKKPLQINATGERIVSLLKMGYKINEIADVLYSELKENDDESDGDTTEDDKSIIEEDVRFFVEQLTKFIGE